MNSQICIDSEEPTFYKRLHSALMDKTCWTKWIKMHLHFDSAGRASDRWTEE